MVITTPYFSDEAGDYLKRISERIVLIDSETLARLMHEHGVGVRTPLTLDVERVDEGTSRATSGPSHALCP